MFRNIGCTIPLVIGLLLCACAQTVASRPTETTLPTQRPAQIIVPVAATTSVTDTFPFMPLRPPIEKTLTSQISQLDKQTAQLDQSSVGSIALDETYIYWTLYADPGHILRHGLVNGETAAIVDTQFDDGDLTVMPLMRSGPWLIFLDTLAPAAGAPFYLRAHNLKDGTDHVVLDSTAGQFSWPLVGAEGDHVAFTFTDYKPDCTETVLAFYDLKLEKYQEIERLCAEHNYLWNFPSLSGNLLAVEQDLPDARGGGSNIYLYNLDTEEFTALTDNGHSSMPKLSGHWITWKDAPRFEAAKRTVALNLQTGDQQVIPLGYDPAYIVEDRWLYWHIFGALQPFYVYDLLNEELLLVAAPGVNEDLGPVKLEAGTIAWWRNLDFEHIIPPGRLEWRSFP